MFHPTFLKYGKNSKGYGHPAPFTILICVFSLPHFLLMAPKELLIQRFYWRLYRGIEIPLGENGRSEHMGSPLIEDWHFIGIIRADYGSQQILEL